MHNETSRLILLLGGARSGKSAYAETLAAHIACDRPVVYIATARADDEEMYERIVNHQAARAESWVTLEAPTDPAAALDTYQMSVNGTSGSPAVVVLDCVTLLVSNLLVDSGRAADDLDAISTTQAEARIMGAVESLLEVYRNGPFSLVLVSNEVGMGVVPPYPLGRVYRDVLGRVNARLAREADAVLLLVAGLPVELKVLTETWRQSVDRLFGLDA
jgi:adenosylcobinamide kinase / adenosylcobinamide-phosphate guanylyltransferase